MKKMQWFLITSIGLATLIVPTIASAEVNTDAVVRYTEGAINFDPGNNPAGQLPQNIDFGAQTIQTTQAETLTATANGEKTTGAVSVSDNRASASGWSIKVNQLTQFQNSSEKELANAALTIQTGNITNNLGNSLTNEGIENQNHELLIGQEKMMLAANEGEGLGETALDLTGFDLAVPANIEKQATTYNTTLNWIFSDSPSDVE